MNVIELNCLARRVSRRFERTAAPVGEVDVGHVGDVGGEAGEDGASAPGAAAGAGEDGHLGPGLGHPSREEQILPGQLKRRSFTQRTPRLLPQGHSPFPTILLYLNKNCSEKST